MAGEYFQVTGLGSQVPGSGVQVQVQDLNFAPYPYLYLITRTRDPRAETWDPGMSPTSRGRADHPWSAAVERGRSTLPKSGAQREIGDRVIGWGHSSSPQHIFPFPVSLWLFLCIEVGT